MEQTLVPQQTVLVQEKEYWATLTPDTNIMNAAVDDLGLHVAVPAKYINASCQGAAAALHEGLPVTNTEALSDGKVQQTVQKNERGKDVSGFNFKVCNEL